MDHSALLSEMEKVEEMSTQERLRLAKKRRMLQLKSWSLREKESKKSSVSPREQKSVHFVPSVMLLEAATRNDIEEVRRLLQSGVSPDSTNEDGLTALHQCCIDDSEEMMKIIIDHGGNVNAVDTEKWTPLHAAATCGHLHLVKFLIDNGANLLAVNADGNMPYDLCEDDMTLSYIENEMAKRGVTQDLIDETRSEIERKMLKDLQELITKPDGDLEYRDPNNGATPLHIASANGYLSVVEFLLEHDVSTEVIDDDYWQPIHAAACWGHLEVLELLAQNGANINACTRNGETPYDICEDSDIKERLLQLREQRLRSEQPRVKRTRSVSTRTQSIRRTSLRDKINTTKRDVQDEKMYFIQKLDSTEKPKEIVDVNDVELTLVTNYEGDPPSPPKRPPRQSKDNNGDTPNVLHNSSSSSSSSVNIHVSVTINAPPPLVPTSSFASTTLSDLKKQRSMSRIQNVALNNSCEEAHPKKIKNINFASNSGDEGSKYTHTKKFTATKNEVVGPPLKESRGCCTII